MSIVSKIMGAAIQMTPDAAPDPLIHRSGPVGQPLNRLDGPLKVRGEATFAAEHQLNGMTHAAIVCSSIAKGKISALHTEDAEKSEGVIAVITHKNAPPMKAPPQGEEGGQSPTSAADDIPILGGDTIYWDGQPVAIVVAQTLDQAQAAAALVRVEYEAQTPTVDFEAAQSDAKVPDQILGEEPEIEIGDAEKALENSPFRVDNVYRTPRYNHNAIEPHATIARWTDGNLEVFDGSQYVFGLQNTLAAIFDVKPEKVRAISPFVGGAFGGKGSVWQNAVICAAAAQVVGRPVKLALSREDVFRVVGGRTPSQQRVALGANRDGELQSLIHSGVTATTSHKEFAEQFTFPARHLYGAPNIFIGQKIVDLDMLTNTFMRAPGESIGTFALESAFDELAHELQIDPIELRLRNQPEKDPTKNTEFSMRNLGEAFRRGAEHFGWQNRAPRSQREGEWLIGQGVATAFYPYYRMEGATASATIRADGSAVIAAAAHEMGQGTATAQTQHAAERLGLPLKNVTFEYGDSALPQSSQAGGSSQTASVGAAVRAAIEKAQRELLELAGKDKKSPLHGLKWEQVEARDGGLFALSNETEGECDGETYRAILERAEKDEICVEAAADKPVELMKYSMQSYGAQFCEVRVNETTGETRVTRWLGSFDTGKILNPQTALSQFRGGIIMGIGMALTEETFFDTRRGRITNPTLAEYHVPVNLDVPDIEAIWLDVPDPHAPLGAHGIGEIGITGAAAAVANAVFNATGKRVRDLPITLDKLM